MGSYPSNRSSLQVTTQPLRIIRCPWNPLEKSVPSSLPKIIGVEIQSEEEPDLIFSLLSNSTISIDPLQKDKDSLFETVGNIYTILEGTGWIHKNWRQFKNTVIER